MANVTAARIESISIMWPRSDRTGFVTGVLRLISRIRNIRLTKRPRFWKKLGVLLQCEDVLDLSQLKGGSECFGERKRTLYSRLRKRFWNN